MNNLGICLVYSQYVILIPSLLQCFYKFYFETSCETLFFLSHYVSKWNFGYLSMGWGVFFSDTRWLNPNKGYDHFLNIFWSPCASHMTIYPTHYQNGQI